MFEQGIVTLIFSVDELNGAMLTLGKSQNRISEVTWKDMLENPQLYVLNTSLSNDGLTLKVSKKCNS